MEPQQSLPAASRDCYVVPSHCLFHCFFKPQTTGGQHPYMQLVSVLYKPVSSISTSLSFFKSFFPCEVIE